MSDPIVPYGLELGTWRWWVVVPDRGTFWFSDGRAAYRFARRCGFPLKMTPDRRKRSKRSKRS